MMKEKKRISRILAIVCAIAVSISSMNLLLFASTPETPTDYTVVDVKDYMGKDEDTYTGAQNVVTELVRGEGTLDGVMVDGIFNLSRYSSVFFGSGAHPNNRFQIRVDNNYNMSCQFIDTAGNPTAVSLGGTAYTGKDTRMQISFAFTNKNEAAGTADVTININVADTIKEEIKVQGANMAQLANTMYVCPNTGSITMKTMEPRTTVDVKNYMGKNEDTYTGAQNVTTELVRGEGTLDGVLIDGIFNLSRYSSVFFGSAAHPNNRFQIRVDNNYNMSCQFIDTAGNPTAISLGGSTYTGKDTRMQIGFVFTNKNETAGTADVVIKINIADTIKEEMTIKGAKMAQLANTMYVCPNTGSITMKTMETRTTVNVSDYMGKAEDTYTGAQNVTTELVRGEGTLDGVLVDGIFKLSRYSSVLFGSAAHPNNRFQIGVTKDYQMYYQFVDSAGQVTRVDLDNTYTDQDTRIKVGFVFTNKNETAGTADVVIKINIADTVIDEMTVKGVNMAQLANTMYVCPNTGSITLKAAPADGGSIEPQPPEEITYDSVLSVSDFTGQDKATYTTESKPSAGDNSLDGVLIDGLYNITGNACFYIGAADWSGLRFELAGTDSIKYRFLQGGAELPGSVDTVGPNDAGCDLWGEDVRIQVGYTFDDATTTDTTTDVTIQVFIGEDYQNTFKLTGVKKSSLIGRMFVYPQSGSVTMTSTAYVEPQEPVEIVYDSTLSVKDFTGQDEVTYTSEIKPSAGDKSLDGVLIDGIYNFKGNAVIYVGAANWTGLRLELAGTDAIRYRFLGSADAHDTTVGPEQTGCDLWEEDVRIKLGFTFNEETMTDTTTDVTIQVFIGDTYQDTFTLTGIAKSSLIGRMFVYPQTGSLTLKSVSTGEPEGPQVPDGFAPAYDKVMKFTDFGIVEDATISGGEAKPNGGDQYSLDKIMVEGTFSFSGLQSAAYIGSRGWGGLRFGGSRDGFTYQFMDLNGQGSLHSTTISEADTGCKLFDSDVRIKAGFTFINENPDGTVDVIIEVQIGETYQDIFALNGVKTSNLIRGMFLYAAADSSITVKVDKSDLQYIKEPSDKKLSYDEEMTFYDFAITKDYVVEGKQTRVRVGGSLDGVSIEGTYFLTGNTIFGFGGDWKGLQFQRTKTGMLYQYLDVGGKGSIYSKSITEEDTGCALYDEDLDIKVGFNFSNEDKAAGTADVTIEVNIGPEYRDVFTVKGVLTANLQKWMLLYAADGNGFTGTKLILRKPYMEPFNFEEFGFTKNWKAELRLK